MDKSRTCNVLRERCFFPCTLLVVLYLLFCGVICLLYLDTGVTTDRFLLAVSGPGGTYEPLLKLGLIDIAFYLILCASFPGRIIARWDGRWLPSGPPGKRRAVLLGYIAVAAVAAACIAWSALAEPPYPLWLYFSPRAVYCLLYLYFCCVANYPFDKNAWEAPSD